MKHDNFLTSMIVVAVLMGLAFFYLGFVDSNINEYRDKSFDTQEKR